MRAAYRSPDPLAGQGDLEALARELDQPTAERRARIHSGPRRSALELGRWRGGGQLRCCQVRSGADGIQGAPANSAVKTSIAPTPCLAAVER